MKVLKNNSTYQLNCKNIANGLDLLKDINDETIAVAFLDPQYRGVLDKLKYGNEGQGRGKARCELQQMDEKTIIKFINEIDRVLQKSGHLFLWVDKFHLCQGVLDWITDTSLNLVDMIVWDKGKIGNRYGVIVQDENLNIL